jgi:predicted ATP-dependent endonuclease of OLD family
MYLHSLKIQGFRKLKNVEVVFSPNTSFLIGANNAGKTSVLAALKLFLSGSDKTEEDNFYKATDEDSSRVDEIVLEGEFRGISADVISDKTWKEFNARRVLKYTENEVDDYRIFYKRTFNRGGKGTFAMQELNAVPKAKYSATKTWQDLITSGLARELLDIADDQLSNKIQKGSNYIDEIYDLDEIWDTSDATLEWKDNPGGFCSNVISKLPKVLLIEPYDNIEECGEKKGALVEILSDLFRDIRDNSQNYKNAIEALKALEIEFNPANPDSSIKTMITELNTTINGVFPG